MFRHEDKKRLQRLQIVLIVGGDVVRDGRGRWRRWVGGRWWWRGVLGWSKEGVHRHWGLGWRKGSGRGRDGGWGMMCVGGNSRDCALLGEMSLGVALVADQVGTVLYKVPC